MTDPTADGFEEPTIPDYSSLVRLDGRHALVLGGGQGLGRQVSIALASQGARVSCADIDENAARQVAEEVGGHPIAGDITDLDDNLRVFNSAVEAFGAVDVVVDVVGAAVWGGLRAVDRANVDESMRINFTHAVWTLRHIAEFASPTGAAVVFVTSISGSRSAPGHAVYGAAKAGLMHLVTTAAVELGPQIRVNSVSPGQMLSKRLVDVQRGNDAFWAESTRVPAGRIGQSTDMAAAVLFFASDLSRYVTGQTLTVDGGASSRPVFPMIER